jgi:hypothetical protein
MKTKFLLLFFLCVVSQSLAFDKETLVERFTNASCVPCAQLNNAWYNAVTQSLTNTGAMSHLVYNVNWPGPNDPMYLLNSNDNMARRSYYGVNWVPWPVINSVYFDFETQGQTQFINSVNAGNAEYSPFRVVITQGAVSNNLIGVGVKIIRDPSDNTTFGNVKLRVALTEKTVHYSSPPGSNGERDFFSICRKMLPDASGTTFTIPAPGDSVSIILEYVPTTEFLQAVNMDSLRVVAFIQDDSNADIYQSAMYNLNRNYLASITTQDEYYFGSSSETAVYTSYIKNEGLFSDTYNINLDYDGPAGWALTFTTINGTFNYGETDAITLNPGDSTQVLANVNASMINGFGQTTVQFISNQGSFGNVNFRFTTFGLNFLVVDDDGGENYEEYFQNELISQSSEYGIITSDFIPSNVASINSFDNIIWNTADTEPGLTTEEMNSIKVYLDNGGHLYLNGVDLAYQLADPASPYYTAGTLDFFTNYLHANYILREHTSTITQGVDGDPITDGLGMMTLVGGTGANTINHSNGKFVNQISASGVNSSIILSFWLKPNEHPGIKALHGTSSKVVFTTFGFETISAAAKRTMLAEKIAEWLDDPVSVGNDLNLNPASFELYQNYPNPFNPLTLIRYSVPETLPVKIIVYDLTGSEVAVVVNQTVDRGTYELNFDAGNLSSGIYFYKMTAGEYNSVRKMSVLK